METTITYKEGKKYCKLILKPLDNGNHEVNVFWKPKKINENDIYVVLAKIHIQYLKSY